MKVTTRIILTAALALSFSAAVPAQNRPQAERITNGPVLEGTGSSWAVVAWTTDTGGSTVVHYGVDRNHLSQTAEAPYSDNEGRQGQNHRVRINNLQPGTTYYYRVDSGQGEGTGTEAMSPIQQFTTKGGNGRDNEGPAQAERITSGPTIESHGPNSAEVVWTTNTGGSSIVRYGSDPNRLTQTAEAPYADTEGAASQSHRVSIRNLQPGTTYYYRVDSGQGEGTGTEAMSPIQQFTAGAGGSGAYGYSGATRSGGQGYYVGNNSANPAAQVGYQDGVNDGRSARQSGQGANARQQQAYEHADHNYSPSYGDRQQYKDAYRQAYQAGFQQGYSGQGYNDPDRDRYGRGGEGGADGYTGRPNPAQQVGYQDGLNDGRSARQSGQGADARQQQAYQHADHNYSPDYGDRQQYKDAYRQAYEQGFQQGYNGRSPQYPQ